LTQATSERIKGFLGLCARAGQTTLGQDACLEAVRRESAALLLMDESSGPTTQKRFLDSCQSHRVPLYGAPPGLISKALGKDGRMTVAIQKGGMARKLLEMLGDERPLAGAEPDRETPDPQSQNSNANHAGVQAVQ
jgi:ribosomal protein L7Ae-like RNA K-turn-binding protein